MKIPFHRPLYTDQDAEAIAAPLRAGKLVGDGEFTRRASAELAARLGVPHVLLTPSCTHALELAVAACGVGAGDEVIVPDFTFVSTADCVLQRGARIVFADVDPRTLTLDVEECARRITPRTKAVIPVGYAGVSPAMDELVALARAKGIRVVEDAAQSVGATYRGRAQGTAGDAGCFSFHETKNISTGEGGAFVTADAELAQRAEIIREKGTNRKQFLLGLVDKYTWVEVGSSYLPPDSTASLLLSQLARLEEVTARRRAVHERYQAAFGPLADERLLTLPHIPAHSGSNYHIYHVLLRDERTRNAALAHFAARGIGTTFHYLPLHLSPVGQRATGGRAGDFPVTESVSARLLRLPIYPSLTEAEQEEVVTAMHDFCREARR